MLSVPALEINVSVLNQEVVVRHDPYIVPPALCSALSDAAFEVYSACTMDHVGTVLSELSFPPGYGGWLDRAAGIWSQSHNKGGQNWTAGSRTPEGVHKTHLENCSACKAEQEKKIENSSQWSDRLAIDRAAGSAWPPEPTSLHPLEAQENLVDNRTIYSGLARSDSPVEKSKNTTQSSILSKRYDLALSIGGMTCVSCTSTIKAVLQDLEFIDSVDVDLMTNCARIRYRGHQQSSVSIAKVVEDAGYQVSIVTCELIPFEQERGFEAPRIQRATLSIGGMTCVACPNAITRGLWELPFVKSVNITLMTSGGDITFEGKDNLEKILEKIDDLGYDCTVVDSDSIQTIDNKDSTVPKRTVNLCISGMFCDHCPPRIVDALSCAYPTLLEIIKSPTIKDPIMSVTYRPTQPDFTIRNIISTISSTNESFTITVYHPPSMEERSRSMQTHERKRMIKRLLLSFIVAVPTLLIGVVWMSLVPDSDGVRQFFAQPVWSGEVTRAEWALFILATPVMFFAADVFHVRALKEIRALWRKGSKVPLLQRFYRFGSMNLLISAGTSIAYVASLALLITGATNRNVGLDTGTYFDTVVFLTFFILLGRSLEAYSKSKTGDTVAMLGKLAPQEALLAMSSTNKRSTSDKEKEDTAEQPIRTKSINADQLEIGDMVIVPHGSSPPADGTIVTGLAQFDESSLTGESRTVKKGPGETVFVGTINKGSPITVQITEIGGTSMLDQIVSIVREGQTKRAPLEHLADILTGYFVPVITALAIITFFIWFTIGQSGVLDPKYLDGQSGGWAFWSLEFAIAVFVVACPCGIGLAAPTALFVGGGLAAKHGILVRGGGEAFQEAGDLDIIVFDKTGTLTEGDTLSVTDHEILAEPFGDDIEARRLTWSFIKSLEEQSSHPIAQAILALATEQRTAKTSIESITEEPGLGVRGSFRVSQGSDNLPVIYEVALGSELLISTLQPAPPTVTYFTSQSLLRWKTEAKSIAILAVRCLGTPKSKGDDAKTVSGGDDWNVAAVFATADPIRPSAIPTIRNLQARGLAIYILSGDNQTTAIAVASALGISAGNVFAGVLPAQKAEKIEWLQAHGPINTMHFTSKNWLQRLGVQRSVQHRRPKVGFVGDGINDTPALHAADISISLSTGSPIAMTSSAFILLSPSLLTIPLLLDLSTRIFRRIKFNFAWALAYNLCLVPVAAGVLFAVNGGGFRLGPVWASAAMAASSVSVVMSSLALRWEGSWKFWRGKDRTEETQEAAQDVTGGGEGAPGWRGDVFVAR